jgi:hypothetical protein
MGETLDTVRAGVGLAAASIGVIAAGSAIAAIGKNYGCYGVSAFAEIPYAVGKIMPGENPFPNPDYGLCTRFYDDEYWDASSAAQPNKVKYSGTVTLRSMELS